MRRSVLPRQDAPQPMLPVSATPALEEGRDTQREAEASRASLTVTILWGDSPLQVVHLSPPRSFFVGEGACDFHVPGLGTSAVPLLLVGRKGETRLVIPQEASGAIDLAGEETAMAVGALPEGRVEPSTVVPRAVEVRFPAGSKARIELCGFVFCIDSSDAPRAFARKSPLGAQALGGIALSVVLHTSLLGAVAFFMPPLGSTEEDGISAEQTYLLNQYLKAAAEKDIPDSVRVPIPTDGFKPGMPGGEGARAKGSEGKSGEYLSRVVNRRRGVEGPTDNPDPHLAKAAALRDAQAFGMVGLLNAGAGGDPNAPTVPFGRDDSLGNDPLSARGNMWATDIGEAFGPNGVGLTGVGEGGGGRGEGIGIGAIGHGWGVCGCGYASGQEFGSGHGRLGGSHRVRSPRVVMGSTSTTGRLPPEVVQRIVRQNHGRFRACYETALRTNPALSGRVSVRFVIGRDGAVMSAESGGSDLADSAVVSCVVRAFYGVSFPQPEDGIVTVTYPLLFSSTT